MISTCCLVLLGRWNKELYTSLEIFIGWGRQGMYSGGKTCCKAVIPRTEKEVTLLNIMN
jgi:hypothetical protein